MKKYILLLQHGKHNLWRSSMLNVSPLVTVFKIRFRSFVDSLFSLHISIFNYAPISFFVHEMCDCWGTCLHYISFLLQRFTMHIVKHYIKCIFNGWNSFYNLRGFIKFCLKIYGFVMLLRSPCRSQKWEKCVTAIIVDALFDFYYPSQSNAWFIGNFSMGFCCRFGSFQIKKPKSCFGSASAFLPRKKKTIVKQQNKLIKSKRDFFWWAECE